MLVRSLIAVLLSIPASAALMGLFLALTPPETTRILPTLLMFFPLWVGLACASYLFPKPGGAAAMLASICGFGFGVIAIVKFLGVSSV